MDISDVSRVVMSGLQLVLVRSQWTIVGGVVLCPFVFDFWNLVQIQIPCEHFGCRITLNVGS
jgi:hypothetical protein